MPKQQLTRSQIAGLFVEQRYLRSPQAMSAVAGWI
jgi:hypothetical protein